MTLIVELLIGAFALLLITCGVIAVVKHVKAGKTVEPEEETPEWYDPSVTEKDFESVDSNEEAESVVEKGSSEPQPRDEKGRFMCVDASKPKKAKTTKKASTKKKKEA